MYWQKWSRQMVSPLATDSAAIAISDQEFKLISRLLHDLAGIDLAPTKKPLVVSRLAKRLRFYALSSFHDYFQMVSDRNNNEELQVMCGQCA